MAPRKSKKSKANSLEKDILKITKDHKILVGTLGTLLTVGAGALAYWRFVESVPTTFLVGIYITLNTLLTSGNNNNDLNTLRDGNQTDCQCWEKWDGVQTDPKRFSIVGQKNGPFPSNYPDKNPITPRGVPDVIPPWTKTVLAVLIRIQLQRLQNKENTGKIVAAISVVAALRKEFLPKEMEKDTSMGEASQSRLEQCFYMNSPDMGEAMKQDNVEKLEQAAADFFCALYSRQKEFEVQANTATNAINEGVDDMEAAESGAADILRDFSPNSTTPGEDAASRALREEDAKAKLEHFRGKFNNASKGVKKGVENARKLQDDLKPPPARKFPTSDNLNPAAKVAVGAATTAAGKYAKVGQDLLDKANPVPSQPSINLKKAIRRGTGIMKGKRGPGTGFMKKGKRGRGTGFMKGTNQLPKIVDRENTFLKVQREKQIENQKDNLLKADVFRKENLSKFETDNRGRKPLRDNLEDDKPLRSSKDYENERAARKNDVSNDTRAAILKKKRNKE
jgi:hypothetical protein